MIPSLRYLQNGMRAWSRKDPTSAVRWLRRAVEGAPDLLPAWMLLGDVQQELDLFDRAIEAYRRALGLLGHDGARAPSPPGPTLEGWPTPGDVLRAMGSCAAAAGRLDEGIEHLRRAVALAPQATNLTALGELLEHRGDRDEARCAFEAAIEQDPQHVEGLYLLACWHVWTDAARAERLFARVLRLDRGHDRARASLGLLLAQRGCLRKGRKELERAARGGGAGSLPYVYLGHLACQAGDDAQAEARYREGMVADPTDPHPHFALGDLHRERGRTTDAQWAYEAAFQVDGSCGDAALRLGTLLDECGKPGEALPWLRRGLALAPQHPWRCDVEKRLHEIESRT